ASFLNAAASTSKRQKGRCMFRGTMYRRGGLCTPGAGGGLQLEAIRGWNRIDLGASSCSLPPETPLRVTTASGGRVALAAGDIFVARGAASLDEELARLCDGDRAPLESLSGRFALFLLDGDEVSVVQDPLGSQTVFYHSAGMVIGSHASLVAEVLSLPRSSRVMA